MSVNDFELDLVRQPDPNGDRVKIVMTGKFLKSKKTEWPEPRAVRGSVAKSQHF
jgi:hypothetical protein